MRATRLLMIGTTPNCHPMSLPISSLSLTVRDSSSRSSFADVGSPLNLAIHCSPYFYLRCCLRPCLHLYLLQLALVALIATGGTAVAAIGMLLDWGLPQSSIKIISVLGSTEGVKHVTEEYPEVEVSTILPTVSFLDLLLTAQVFIGAVDKELTDKGYISPGLGDAVSY